MISVLHSPLDPDRGVGDFRVHVERRTGRRPWKCVLVAGDELGGAASQGTKQRARGERTELGGKDLEAALFHPRPEMEHSTSPPQGRERIP